MTFYDQTQNDSHSTAEGITTLVTRKVRKSTRHVSVILPTESVPTHRRARTFHSMMMYRDQQSFPKIRDSDTLYVSGLKSCETNGNLMGAIGICDSYLELITTQVAAQTIALDKATKEIEIEDIILEVGAIVSRLAEFERNITLPSLQAHFQKKMSERHIQNLETKIISAQKKKYDIQVEETLLAVEAEYKATGELPLLTNQAREGHLTFLRSLRQTCEDLQNRVAHTVSPAQMQRIEARKVFFDEEIQRRQQALLESQLAHDIDQLSALNPFSATDLASRQKLLTNLISNLKKQADYLPEELHAFNLMQRDVAEQQLAEVELSQSMLFAAAFENFVQPGLVDAVNTVLDGGKLAEQTRQRWRIAFEQMFKTINPVVMNKFLRLSGSGQVALHALVKQYFLEVAKLKRPFGCGCFSSVDVVAKSDRMFGEAQLNEWLDTVLKKVEYQRKSPVRISADPGEGFAYPAQGPAVRAPLSQEFTRF